MDQSVALRPVMPQDRPALLALWNPWIADSTITFSSELKTHDGLDDMIIARRAAGHEFFVAMDGAQLLGLATYAQFRGGNGYRHAMEHTVVLSPAARGRGIGRALMEAVENHARAAGAHVMVAGICGENDAAIAFHRALGYAQTGRMPQVGRKFDRWLDLVLMQKSFDGGQGRVSLRH